MIDARALAKRFGAVQAVADASFAAADGRITALLGPNGAGKSTTLRMLYTVLHPDAGSAAIDGHDIVAAPIEVRRRIGVLPHAAGLYPQLDARENIRYFGRLQGLRGELLERRIASLVEQLDLGEFAGRPARGYSQGQRTRVALARALVHAPRNLLLDEPTNGLDVIATRGLRALITRLRDAGHCIVLSSHIMQEVAALADRIIILAAGRVVAAGTADEICRATGRRDLEEAFVSAVQRAAMEPGA